MYMFRIEVFFQAEYHMPSSTHGTINTGGTTILHGDIEPGTLQLSNTSSHVFDPLMPSLSSFGDVLKPSIPCRVENRSDNMSLETDWDSQLAHTGTLS